MRIRPYFLLVVLAAFPVFARETVLEDTPSRLTIEVSLTGYRVEAGPYGSRVAVDGFNGADASGAPDLPWYRFQIASGSQTPSVSIVPEEWIDLSLPKELEGVPHWVTTQKREAAKDAVLFSSAGSLNTKISRVQLFRGMSLRDVGFAIATYGTGTSTVHLLKRFKVQVTFPDARSNPDGRTLEWLVRAGVKNPQGGQYLTSIPRPSPLGKLAATQVTFSGTYLKIRIGDRQVDGLAEDGVYALPYEQAVAASALIDNAKIDFLRMYAGPKDTLRAAIDAGGPLAPTLMEIPIQVLDKNNNGSFDKGDTILFYAHGTSLWKPISGATGPVRWKFGSDPYSFDNYYYLNWSTQKINRLAFSAVHAAVDTVKTTPHYLRAERDNATGSCQLAPGYDPETGFDWFWYFKGGCDGGPVTPPLTASQLRSSTIDTIKDYAGDTTWLGFFTYQESNDTNAFQVWAGGRLAASVLPAVSGAWYMHPAALANQKLGLDSIHWGGSDDRFEGYTVKYSRTLKWTGQNRIVFPASSVLGKWAAYRVSNGKGINCLRVESGVGARLIPLQTVDNDAVFTDSAGGAEDVQYFLYANAEVVDPASVAAEKVHTEDGMIQNLLTGNSQTQYLIVAPEALIPGALELCNYRNSPGRQMSLVTSVVRTEDIYRDWSGGRLSPMAIRDLLRWALNHWGGNLRYVLLYGDGHYDYRNILNAASKNPAPNHVPPFNWDDPGDSHNPMSTDDFYAVLDSAGDWRSGKLAVALSRLSVQTLEEGRNYLDKVSRYEDPHSAGDWRAKVTLTADDATQHGAKNDVDEISDPSNNHTASSELLGSSISTVEPGVRLEKIYLFDYQPNANFLKPEAQQDLITNLNNGTLLFTFFGHGAYNQLADEVLMKTNETLTSLRNTDKAFMVGVFSCTVGRFEKLADQGMMEQFVKQKDYAAIVGLGASRESFPGPNTDLGVGVVSRIFSVGSSNLVGVGDAVQGAKNSLGNGGEYNKQKYGLFGEPVVVIRRPGPPILPTQLPDTLRALQCGTLRGRIPGGSGRGNINIRIVAGDVQKTYTFKDNPDNPAQLASQTVMKRGQILFERTVPYKDSAFSVDFFLPKQVPFGDSTASIQFYAWDSVKPLESVQAVTGLWIRGTAAQSACSLKDDSKGPRIAVTGCNSKESGNVNFPDQVKVTLPYCFQFNVTDSASGVLSGDGPDEGTTVELVGSVDPYHPQPGVDDLYFKSYQLTLQTSQVSPGTHLLKISAHDGFGNLSQRQMTLTVSTDSTLSFVRTFNSPNPVKRNGTAFYFSTVLPQDLGEALVAPNTDRVQFDLRIFDQLGRLVREFPTAQSGQFWDGTDAWGHTLANGVYFYQVTAIWDPANGAPGQGQQTSQRNTLVLSR